MSRMRLVAALVCAAVVICALWFRNDRAHPKVVHREGEPDYVQTGGNPAVERAVAKAKATQAEFVKALQHRKPTWSGFAVKKGFPTPSGGKEHIWIGQPSWDGRMFHGLVDNEPVETKTVKLGDAVTVTPEELSDWMYLDGDRLIGGYTVRALVAEQSPEERAQFEKSSRMRVPPVDF